jgi:4-amino-4-deoxy-L-arabinose transferase-like glycosyltransferase
MALIPLALGFGLRLYYLAQAAPFVDEPTTLLAAQAVASSGVPTLPSGLFYGNDLPFSYLSGGLLMVFGPHLETIRMFSLVVSVLTLALVYQMGKQLFSPWVGIWGALLLALIPEAIRWGGRARAYALLAFLVLLAVWLFYAGVKSEQNGKRRLGLATLVVAAFVHPEAALLLPAFVLGVVLHRGWRWWFQRSQLAELLVVSIGMGTRLWLQMALARGQLSGFETSTGSRPPLELIRDWPARFEGLSPFFLDPDRLALTILALLALVSVGTALAHKRKRKQAQSILFLSVCLWLVPVEMLLFLGGTYQSPRYLNMLLPLFALLAGCGLEWVVAWVSGLQPLRGWRSALVGLATVLLVGAYLPGAVAASSSREEGFRAALQYVAQHRQPGDLVGTVAPAYCEFVLGQCDYFTLGLGYEEFVYRTAEGQWVDRWLGLPLVQSVEDLADVLDQGARLWFVVDEERLRERFDPAFAQAIWQRMDLRFKADQVMVFVSHELLEPAASRSLEVTFGSQVALLGYDVGLSTTSEADAGWGEVVAQPGQALPLTLYWEAVEPILADYTVFVHLLGPDEVRYAQGDGPPLSGIQPMTHWVQGEVLPDRRVLDLPATLSPGRYRLEVGLYESGTGERLPAVDGEGQLLGDALTLDYVRVLGQSEPLPSPAQPMRADLGRNGDRIRLLGYTLPAGAKVQGDVLPLRLYWQALVPVQTDYTVFVHLLDEDGVIQGQGDGPPVGGVYPTSFWDPGETVEDEHQVLLSVQAEEGIYRLAVGMYLVSTGDRMTADDGDRVILGEVQVER